MRTLEEFTADETVVIAETLLKSRPQTTAYRLGKRLAKAIDESTDVLTVWVITEDDPYEDED